MTEDFKVIKFESSSWKVVHKISQLFQCSVVNCIDIFLDYMLSHLQKITWSSVGDLLEIIRLVIRPRLAHDLSLWALSNLSSTFCTSRKYMRACVLSHFSCVLTPFQAPLSMGFSRHKYWSGFPCSSFSKGSSQPRDRTHISYISCTGRQVLHHQRHLGTRHWSITWILC